MARRRLGVRWLATAFESGSKLPHSKTESTSLRRQLHRRTSFCLASTLAAASLLFAACGRKDAHDDHAHAGHAHEHVAPHGGTVVVLGDEQFHLEFVRDPAAGKLTAYVLDAHLEDFIRIPAAGFEIAATAAGRPETLTLTPVANLATGETVGDSAEFATQADWLKTTSEFDAVLSSITIRGATFTGVKFNFPQGNEAD
jgi:hypothetical protein